jgi:hypothetical protein
MGQKYGVKKEECTLIVNSILALFIAGSAPLSYLDI